MIPISLKLSNFTSYGKNFPELTFTKFHLAAISGPNGAGKSSLLDAITWALWGWSRAGDISDELIHKGAKDMFVEFTFKLDKDEFTVKRARLLSGGGSTNLELWAGSHNLTEGTIKATQEKIIQLLHLTFETFTNSSFLRQGHADEFTTKGPTDRKRVLADILGLSHYDVLEEKAREKVKDIQNSLKLLEYQLLEIETELSQKAEGERKLSQSEQEVSHIEGAIKVLEEDLKLLQKEKETLSLVVEQRQKLEQNLKEQQQELAQIIQQGKKRAERIRELEESTKVFDDLRKKIEELKSLKLEVEKLTSLKEKRLEIEKRISDMQGALNLKNKQKQMLEEEIKLIEDEIKKLTLPRAKCPTCGQEIGKDRKHKVGQMLDEKLNQKKLDLSKISTKVEEKELDNLKIEIGRVIFDDKKLQSLQQSIAELENLQRQKEKILGDQASLETERKTREELLILYKNKHAQIQKLEADLAKLPKVIKDISQVVLGLTKKEEQLTTLRAEEKEARGFLGQAKELISRAKQLEKVAKQKQQEKVELQKRKENFEELVQAFGKKGIQAMIIETAIPEIEDEANRLLQKLTDGKMQVRFETQRETKTKLESGEKGIIETLDIIISDEMGERPYENYSGGEQFRINVAIRLALSKLLTRRAGAKLQFLVIDEGFGTQDQEGRTKIVEVLDSIKDDFEKILVITHLEELKEEFPVRIEVSKNSSGSTFEVVGT